MKFKPTILKLSILSYVLSILCTSSIFGNNSISKFSLFSKNQNSIDSVVPNLRLLASRGGSQQYVEKNYNGFSSTRVTELQNAAHEVLTAIPVDLAPTLQVYDFESYSLIDQFEDEGKFNDAIFKKMEGNVQTKDHIAYFLLLGKEFNPKDRKFQYRVTLKLPTVEHPSDNAAANAAIFLTDAELAEITNGIQSAMSSSESGAGSKAGDSQSTLNGILEAKKLLEAAKNGTLEVSAPLLGDLKVLSPDGKIVTPEKTGNLRYFFNSSPSYATSYCYQYDVYDLCLPWENDNTKGYGFERHFLNNIHYELPLQPQSGQPTKVARLEMKNKCSFSLYSVDWSAADVAGFPGNFESISNSKAYVKEINICDKNAISDRKKKEVQDWLKDLDANDTEVRISRCSEKDNQIVITKTSTNAGKGDKKIMIDACLEGDGQWKINWHDFANNALVIPTGYKGTIKQVKDISDKQAEKIIKAGGVRKFKSTDDELEYKEMGIIAALIELKEATKKLCNEAKIPEKAWDDKNHKAEYDASPYHFPTFSGAGDGVINQVKDIPELVSFGLTIATDPDEAMKLWTAIKSLSPERVKTMIIGAAQAKKDKYAGGGNTMKHEAGMDGVSLAMALFTGGGKKMLENVADIKNLKKAADEFEDIADDVLDGVSDNIDDAISKDISKELNEGITDAIEAESSIDALGDMAENTTGKVELPEYKAKRKRGNDFNAKRKTDYDYSEITIEHPDRKYTKGKNKGKPKRYILDSYGEDLDIVSRKATNLSEIKQTTFERHLRELVSKYPEGAKIVKPSKPEIHGKVLKGNFKLEIPETNMNFPRLQEYRDLAKDFMYNGKKYSIDIILKPE
ncbi:MAG: hypothetical protein ACOYOA_14540 [Saprospiraceae bacterium]